MFVCVCVCVYVCVVRGCYSKCKYICLHEVCYARVRVLSVDVEIEDFSVVCGWCVDLIVLTFVRVKVKVKMTTAAA